MITRTRSGSKYNKKDYVTFCVRRPKTITKSFSIEKYGIEKAIELAVQARDLYLEQNKGNK